MANILRLILALVLSFALTPSEAAQCTSTSFTAWTRGFSGTGFTPYEAAVEAIKAANGASAAASPGRPENWIIAGAPVFLSAVVWEAPFGSYGATYMSSGTVNGAACDYEYESEGQCVGNAERVTGNSGPCKCVAGFRGNANATACDRPDLCGALTGLTMGQATTEVSVGSMSSAEMAATLGKPRNFCGPGGCVASGNTTAGLKSNSGEVTLLVADAKFNGSSCDSGAAPGSGDGMGTSTIAQLDPSDCSKKKMCSGTANGMTICTTCITTGETSSTSTGGTTTTSTGNGTSTSSGSSTTAGTSGGSSTTTKNTVCEGSKCTTTATTTSQDTSGVTTTKQTTTTETKDDFCIANPKSAFCLVGTFGGSCSGGFTCGGDAVQCALAKETFRQNCAMQPSQAVIDGYTAGAGKTGPQVTQTSVEITSSMFSQENVLGAAASCIADKSITVAVAGKSFALSLPFSKVCPYLEYLGYLNLALSFILAARIVGRG